MNFLVSPAIGQNDSTTVHTADTTDKYFRLFENEETVEITLRFDLSTYLRTKPKTDYLKANLSFHLGNTDSVSADIKLRTRGEFRNRYCTYAPIELNFKKADFGYKDLNSISQIKLVPECQPGTENSNYVLREYLIYKMFNILSDTSFRVRLLNVTYIDTEKKRKPVKQYGFFIEPLKMLTERTNSIQVKSLSLTQKSIVPRIIDRLAIFNYMIGNYDWGVPGQHNVKVIKPLVIESSGLGIAIPYDFDWTGFVNASYAIPAEVVGIQNIRERLFEGICRSKEVYLKDLEIFAKNKEAFYRVINEFPYLNKKEKRDMTVYLDDFFNQFERKSQLIDKLLNNCKNF
jgi:hypothetical protein